MKEKESINTIAKDLLSKHKGNPDKASKALKKMLLTNPQLVEEYKDEIFGRAASAIVQSVFAIERSHVYRTVPTLEKGQSGEMQQANIAKKVAASIINEVEIHLNMFLNVCKKRLRYVTRTDLAKEINMHLTNARGNDSRATFLNMIYEGLEEDQSVGECYDEESLNRMMERTQKKISKEWSKRFVKAEETIEV